MTLTPTEITKLETALGLMLEETPVGVDFERLTTPQLSSPGPRSVTRPAIAAAVGFLAVIAVFAVVLGTRDLPDIAATPPGQSLFLVPTDLPDGFTRSDASFDPNLRLTAQTFVAANEARSFEIVVRRYPSGGLTGSLDEHQIALLSETTETGWIYDFTPLEVRGLRSLLAEPPLGAEGVTQLRIEERNGVFSNISSTDLTTDEILAIGEGLQSISESEFEALLSAIPPTAPYLAPTRLPEGMELLVASSNDDGAVLVAVGEEQFLNVAIYEAEGVSSSDSASGQLADWIAEFGDPNFFSPEDEFVTSAIEVAGEPAFSIFGADSSVVVFVRDSYFVELTLEHGLMEEAIWIAEGLEAVSKNEFESLTATVPTTGPYFVPSRLPQGMELVSVSSERDIALLMFMNQELDQNLDLHIYQVGDISSSEDALEQLADWQAQFEDAEFNPSGVEFVITSIEVVGQPALSVASGDQSIVVLVRDFYFVEVDLGHGSIEDAIWIAEGLEAVSKDEFEALQSASPE